MAALDYTTVQQSIDGMMTAHGQFIVQSAASMKNALAVTALLYECGKSLLDLYEGAWNFLVKYAARLWVVGYLLAHYYSPMAWTPFSYSALWPALADNVAAKIDDRRSNILFDRTDAVLMDINHQRTLTNVAMLPTAYEVEGLMYVYQAAGFISIAMSFMAVGVLRLIGPYPILAFLFPRFSHLFWNWQQAIWEYCTYRVMGSAATFVLSEIMNNFLLNTMHGDYSLAHWAVMVGRLVWIVVGGVWFVFRLANITADLYKGTATAASGFITSMVSMRRLETLRARP